MERLTVCWRYLTADSNGTIGIMASGQGSVTNHENGHYEVYRQYRLINDSQLYQSPVFLIRLDQWGRHLAPAETGNQEIEPPSQIDEAPATRNGPARDPLRHRVAP